jgi:hypothetical protein
VLRHQGVDDGDASAGGGEAQRQVRSDEPEAARDEARRAAEGIESIRVGVGHGGVAGGKARSAERSR